MVFEAEYSVDFLTCGVDRDRQTCRAVEEQHWILTLLGFDFVDQYRLSTRKQCLIDVAGLEEQVRGR